MFTIDPKSFSDTRIQLHWAVQLLSAAADATLEKADDDSQSNLGWDSKTNKLLGRSGCDFDVVKFELENQGEVYSLAGKKLAEAGDWLGQKLDKEIVFRDYDMPEHGVGKDESFAPNEAHLKEIAKWYSLGQQVLGDNGELRVWPHHFDLGFWAPGSIEGRSIGGGLSPGDNYYPQPYLYITPYGVEKPDVLPALDIGNWTEHWFGTVLTAEKVAASPDPLDFATQFVNGAMAASEKLIAGA